MHRKGKGGEGEEKKQIAQHANVFTSLLEGVERRKAGSPIQFTVEVESG